MMRGGGGMMRKPHRLAVDLDLVAERDALADVRRLAVDRDRAVDDQPAPCRGANRCPTAPAPCAASAHRARAQHALAAAPGGFFHARLGSACRTRPTAPARTPRRPRTGATRPSVAPARAARPPPVHRSRASAAGRPASPSPCSAVGDAPSRRSRADGVAEHAGLAHSSPPDSSRSGSGRLAPRAPSARRRSAARAPSAPPTRVSRQPSASPALDRLLACAARRRCSAPACAARSAELASGVGVGGVVGMVLLGRSCVRVPWLRRRRAELGVCGRR